MSDGAALTSDGRAFHVHAADTENALSPSVEQLNNASQVRPASWIQQNEDVVSDTRYSGVTVGVVSKPGLAARVSVQCAHNPPKARFGGMVHWSHLECPLAVRLLALAYIDLLCLEIAS